MVVWVGETDFEVSDVESVGGLIADDLGRIPMRGDHITQHPLAFEVLEMDGYRVAAVRVTRLPDLIDEDDEESLAHDQEPE